MSVCEFCMEEVEYENIRDLNSDGEYAICVDCIDNPTRSNFKLVEKNIGISRLIHKLEQIDSKDKAILIKYEVWMW